MTKFNGWSKKTDGGFWSTASLTQRAEGDFSLVAQEYRTRVAVFLTRSDVKRLRDYLDGVLAGD